ncbi:MAG: SDR family oxidoreductase [Vicinamibacterales bacterium]
MILVVGATGVVGNAVVQRLRQNGKDVRAFVRDVSNRDKRAALEQAGATLAFGDLKDRGTVRAACEGIDTIVSTASATISRGAGDDIYSVDRDGQLQLVEVAREAGVRHFIYLSFSGNVKGSFPLHDAKRAVERRLQDSGLTFTIVRPSFFMEVWLSPHAGFDPVGGQVRIYGSGDAPVSMVSAMDVAAYVAACVDNPAAHNQVIELGGPDAVTPNAIVALFEKGLGRSIARTVVPEAVLEQQLATAQDPLQKTLAGLALCVARGDAIDNRPALERARIPLTTVGAFVDRRVRI